MQVVANTYELLSTVAMSVIVTNVFLVEICIKFM